MCDTQVITTQQGVFFAKNSDREASEPQHIVRIAPVSGDKSKTVDTTYISVPQTENRYGVILSQPSWIWGAEIGINDQGVAIGNEAVFTKLVDKKGQSLLGMDLLRLALERSSCADEALSVITRLLDTYGQGGPAGFRDKSFRYDNSFIITDSKKTWILETAGTWWVAKQVQGAGAISNTLSIDEDYDLAKSGVEDFARKEGYTGRFSTFSFAKAFNTFWMPLLGAAKSRRALSLNSLMHHQAENQTSIRTMIAGLRAHHSDKTHFKKHSNRDVCMHAGSLLRPSQTCGSMVARLEPGREPEVMMTGTSAPCLSLFKPVNFEFDHPLMLDYKVNNKNHYQSPSLWQRFEPIHRRALQDERFRTELKASRDEVEQQLFDMAIGGEIPVTQADRLAQQWHLDWEKRAAEKPLNYNSLKVYDRFWQKA